MTTIAAVIAEARKGAGLNQSELARRLGITPQSVQAWESGKSVPRTNMLWKIAEVTGADAEPILAVALAARTTRPEDKAKNALLMMREMLQRDSSETEAPSQEQADVEDESDAVMFISIPLIDEVELGSGAFETEVRQLPGKKIALPLSVLRTAGVSPESALCATVSGDSMAPPLPDGSLIAFDTKSTLVRDGKAYVLNQGGQLRVKLLHRLPGGGIRLRSFNREDYPDEEYTSIEMTKFQIQVLGRVFWSQAIW